MLARTPATLVYLSAEELGITERERAGLIEVRDDLASGRVKHANHFCSDINGSDDPGASYFNMLDWRCQTVCGTAHCIGGFMRARGCLNQDDKRSYSEGSYAINPLFYPICSISGKETPAQAVRAIDHFLSGAGSECWPMVLADIPAA